MPSIIAHGIMGYLLNNNKIGIIYSILPDIIGYTRYIGHIGYIGYAGYIYIYIGHIGYIGCVGYMY